MLKGSMQNFKNRILNTASAIQCAHTELRPITVCTLYSVQYLLNSFITNFTFNENDEVETFDLEQIADHGQHNEQSLNDSS